MLGAYCLHLERPYQWSRTEFDCITSSGTICTLSPALNSIQPSVETSIYRVWVSVSSLSFQKVQKAFATTLQSRDSSHKNSSS